MLLKKKSYYHSALALLGLLFFSSCLKKPELIHLTGNTMGTRYNVKYYVSNDPRKDEIHKKINQLLVDLNDEMSTYIKSSQISYFNQTDRLGWIEIKPDFFEVTRYALELANQTKGIFDPTIGPLVNLWGFGPNGERKVPNISQIEEARKRVGFQKILLNESRREIKKTVPRVYLDLSSLAKGFGVDKVATFLEEEKIQNFMVEIGGEIKTKGKKAGGLDWKIAIEAPHPSKQGKEYQRVLNLNSLSLATSGSYRNYFIEKGKSYSHTIDVKSGRPVNHRVVSVSVVDKASCMKADALATAIMAMGYEKGLKFAESNKIAAFFVYSEGSQKEIKFVTDESTEFKRLFSNKSTSGL